MKQHIMKALFLFISIFFTVTTFSQSTINNYKYVLVPDKYDFLREADQYGLNSATKQLLEEKGFVAFVGNKNLPPELIANKCNALTADVVQKKGIFVTNLTLQLKDCQGNIIFKSKEGKSREKEFAPAYNLALRDAFASLKDVPYKYDGTVAAQPQQPAVMPAASPATTTPATTTTTTAPATSAGTDITGTLYAQAITNGYQLVDTSPKKVLTLLKTSTQDYYIAEGGPANGIVFKKDNEWVFEYYKDNKLVSQKLEIRF
jgi:hypothetical protein